MYQGTIEPDLPDHVATTFEGICQEAVWELVRRGELRPVSDVGRWWYGEDEIDIVGLAPNDDRILFAECKWTAEPVGTALAEDLRDKTDAVQWGPDDRVEQFALFSKRGFVDGMSQELGSEWSLIDLDAMNHLFTTDT